MEGRRAIRSERGFLGMHTRRVLVIRWPKLPLIFHPKKVGRRTSETPFRGASPARSLKPSVANTGANGGTAAAAMTVRFMTFTSVGVRRSTTIRHQSYSARFHRKPASHRRLMADRYSPGWRPASASQLLPRRIHLPLQSPQIKGPRAARSSPRPTSPRRWTRALQRHRQATGFQRLPDNGAMKGVPSFAKIRNRRASPRSWAAHEIEGTGCQDALVAIW